MGIICLLFPVFFREVVCAPGGPEGVGEGGFGGGGGGVERECVFV